RGSAFFGRLLRSARTAILALAHEAVELLLILGAAQLAHVLVELLAHGLELAALLGQALQLPLAPFVEGNVAGAAETAIAAARSAGEHAVRRAVDAALELMKAVAPQDVGEHGEAERPEHHEADHHQGDRRRC